LSFQALQNSHQVFIKSLAEAEKNLSQVLAIDAEARSLLQKNSISGLQINPYSKITAQVCLLVIVIIIVVLNYRSAEIIMIIFILDKRIVFHKYNISFLIPDNIL